MTVDRISCKPKIMNRSKFVATCCLSVVAFSGLIYATSCRKASKGSEDISYVTDHAKSEQTFNDVQSIADDAAGISSGGSLGYKGTGNGCAIVTRTPGSIIIDFGPDNCLCHDGRYRRGKVLVNCTGNYGDSGSVHTITFDNFYQNDNKVTGTRTVTNMGRNALGQPWFTIHIVGSVTQKGGGTITSEWTRVRTWTQGYATTDQNDDIFEITGSGHMVRANGNEVNISISSPLIMAGNCHWVEAGTVTYNLPGGVSRVLNFGDVPACDNKAVITLANGTTKNIELP
jgi:hypothetical protein